MSKKLGIITLVLCLIAVGLSAAALVKAAAVVAVPGTSEHQTGLSVDIMDENYPYLDEGQENTEAQAWLM